MTLLLGRSASGAIISLLNPESVHPFETADMFNFPIPSTSPPRASTDTSSARLSARASALPPRKRQCVECLRTFSTSGHLTRHGKVHTGERDQHCPYPGCHRQCSRFDNLVQHYKMHVPRNERDRGSAPVRDALQRMREKVELEQTKLGRMELDDATERDRSTSCSSDGDESDSVESPSPITPHQIHPPPPCGRPGAGPDNPRFLQRQDQPPRGSGTSEWKGSGTHYVASYPTSSVRAS